MNIDYVKVDGKDIPAKFNPRSKSNWEKQTGLIWSSLFGSRDSNGKWIKEPVVPTVEQSMILCLEVLREGHRRDKTKFNITLDDVYDYADDYDLETQITDLIFGKSESEKKVESVKDLSDFSIAFSYGVSYSDYLKMSDNELNQAILGGQYKESREFRLLRLIAFMIGKYIGAFNKSLKIEKFYPLMFDSVSKKRDSKEEWEAAKLRWAKRDANRAKKGNV